MLQGRSGLSRAPVERGRLMACGLTVEQENGLGLGRPAKTDVDGCVRGLRGGCGARSLFRRLTHPTLGSVPEAGGSPEPGVVLGLWWLCLRRG